MRLKSCFYAVFAVFLLILGTWAVPIHGAGEENEPGKGQVRALMYHHFGMEDQYPSTSVSMEQFENHLAYLEENDFTVLTLGEALDRLNAGKAAGENIAVITIDDGYQSIWDNAMPLLEAYGYKATVFIATEPVGGSGYLDWEQIRALQDKGYEIGGHSHTHGYFLNRPEGEVTDAFEADLKKSHEAFEAHLGEVPTLYAYPFGEFEPGMKAVLKNHGYEASAAQKSGVIYEGTDRFAMPRFPMNVRFGDLDGFAEKLGMNAMRVVEARPENPVVGEENPPALELRIDNAEINTDGLQCFVAGRPDCGIEARQEDGILTLRVQAENELTARRTLYTITAPSMDGSRWFWYSYSWVIPERK